MSTHYEPALFMMQSFEKQTNLLAWHEMLYCFQNNVNTHENLHHSRCNRSKHTSPCVPSHLKIASKIASTNHLHGIAIENCFENSVNTHEPALWCNHSKNNKSPGMAWICRIASETRCNRSKQLITLHGIAIENCFENRVKTTPGMASQLNIASKTMSTHMSLHCFMMQSFRKTNHLAWHGFVELHRKQCQHMRICTIQDAIVQKTSKSPCMASQLKIAWRIASKKTTWHGVAIEILLRKQCQHT